MSNSWNYRPWATDPLIEVGRLSAAKPIALACHVHPDVQISAVRTGWRVYTTSIGEFRATAGDIVVIPGGVPHSSHGGEGSIVTHLYVSSAHTAVRGVARPQRLRHSRASSPEDLLVAVGAADLKDEARFSTSLDLAKLVLSNDLEIGVMAERSGYSSDGFIRAFKRQIGMTPGAYRLAMRLAASRARLKKGDTVADVAYAGFFADQSHFGRHFRRAYGVTPAAYRIGFAVGRSISFQTRRGGDA
jgi:AraC-like DNA-binding protein